MAAGALSRRLAGLPDVGDGGEAAGIRDAEPGAARLQVAAAIDMGQVGPLRRNRGRAREELVAVGRDDQRVFRVLLPRNQNQAYGRERPQAATGTADTEGPDRAPRCTPASAALSISTASASRPPDGDALPTTTMPQD